MIQMMGELDESWLKPKFKFKFKSKFRFKYKYSCYARVSNYLFT